MHVDIQAQRGQAGRTIIFTLLAVLALLLSSPPSARADHGGQPDTSCGFTGTKTLVLHPGDQFPLPTRYENLTGTPWTFRYIIIRDDLPFNLPGELLRASLGSALTLPPFKVASFAKLGYTLPLTTTTGTGHVTYWAFASFSGSAGSTLLNPARCEFDLTVEPLFTAGITDSEETGKDHH